MYPPPPPSAPSPSQDEPFIGRGDGQPPIGGYPPPSSTYPQPPESLAPYPPSDTLDPSTVGGYFMSHDASFPEYGTQPPALPTGAPYSGGFMSSPGDSDYMAMGRGVTNDHQSPPVPRTQQPQSWMPRPMASTCPPGLEYLTQISQLLIKQQKELLEIITDIETPNRYLCMNTMGQVVYTCVEEANFLQMQLLQSSRPFTMHVMDNMGTEVIRIIRPYRFSCGFKCCNCSECCQDEVEIQTPVGQTVGYVKHVYRGCKMRYEILNANKNVVLQIHGPSYCMCTCFGADIDFKVMSADGVVQVGKISKQWTNILQEVYTAADNFGVSFPMDLDVRMKAVMIGAVFLIDFMYFEQRPRVND